MNSVPIFAAAALTLFAGSVRADWLQFRGPDASARGTGQPPVTFQPSDIVWKTALPGRGLSSPVIVGGKVFLTAASGPDQETLHVICLDNTTGKKLWERRFQATGRTMCHEKTNVAAPTPASDGTRVFALFSSNDCFGLDLEGNLLWVRGFTLDYPNASNSLGLASSPIMVGGVLVTMVENDGDSFTLGIDPATGTNLWKLARPKNANWTSPTAWQDPASGRPLVLVTAHEGVLALDPQTGKEQWTLPKPGTTIPSAGIGEKHFAVPRPGKGLAVYTLAGGTTPPELAWESAQINSDTASPVLQGPRVFALNGAGVLSCAELATGDRPWKLRMEGPFSGSPVMSGTTLYAVSERGLLQAVDTTAAEGAVTGKLDLGTTILCTPSLSGNSIYVRSDGHVWRIGK
jgi:outer membrane protein assembly factor BamB